MHVTSPAQNSFSDISVAMHTGFALAAVLKSRCVFFARTTRDNCLSRLSSPHRRGVGCVHTRLLLQTQLSWAAAQVKLKDSMFFEDGKAWGRSRRLISPNLNGHNVGAMLSIMSKVMRLAGVCLVGLVWCVWRRRETRVCPVAAKWSIGGTTARTPAKPVMFEAHVCGLFLAADQMRSCSGPCDHLG